MTLSRWLLAALVVVYLLLAGAYAAVIPVFEGFDAQAHYAAIHYFRSERTLPELAPETVARSYELIPHPPLYYVLAALAGTGWPLEQASEVAQASANAYFDKSLAARQSVTLPNGAWQELAPAWAARFVSTLGGLVVLTCTWWMARRLAPQAPTFALASAAIATFNPQFLFTAVTISNDGWSAAMAALALAVGVDVVITRRSPSAWLWVGAAAGLAALTKYSTLAVMLPLGILFLLAWQQRGWRKWRPALAAVGYAAAAFAVVAGWWFVRNWLLYAEIVPLDRMAEVLPTMRRAEPYTWQRTIDHIPWLIASFWGVFVAIIAPPFYLDATRWFMLIGFAGLAFGLVLAAVHLRRTRTRPSLAGMIVYLVLLPWLAAVAAMVLYWTRTVEYGEQGRLAHVGASAFGVVMVAGWQAWLPVSWLPRLYSWRTALHALLAVGAVATSLALVPFLQDNFGLPPAPPPATADRPLAASFGGGMRLLGVDLPQGAAMETGKPLPLTLYFTTDAPVPEDYTLFLHVSGAGDRLLYQFDGVPAQGRHPTRQWIPGRVFADTHTITVDDSAEDGLATLSMGFYPIADPSTRVEVYDANGRPIGDRLILAPLRLHSQTAAPPPAPARPVGVWQNGIVLAEAQLATDVQGLPAGVALTWTPTATIQSDYTVFVQVLDADNNILAQLDSQPQAANYPTSTWRAGDVIADTLAWQGEVRTWDRVILGLYGADGVRLPLVQGGDAVEIAASR
jgi:4-amino-4-deoxy-L-arabinose transferase-like glycosyltransferase